MSEHEKFIANLPFPPVFDDECEKECISGFRKATSPESMKTVECAVCAVSVREIDIKNNKFPIDEFKVKHGDPLLLAENQDNPDENLEEYIHHGLLLSEGGINDDNEVQCCNDCLRDLKNKKLPKNRELNAGGGISSEKGSRTKLRMCDQFFQTRRFFKMYPSNLGKISFLKTGKNPLRTKHFLT